MNSNERIVSQCYDNASKYYDQWAWQDLWRHNEKPLIQEALARDGLVATSLDAGVGTGAYTDLLRRYSMHVMGIDISIGMLGELLEKYPRASCACASASAIPLKRNSCQRILAARVLSHIAKPEPFFAEAGRVLSTGGTVIVSDLDPEHEYTDINLPGSSGGVRDIRLAPHNHSLDDLSKAAVTANIYLERSWRLNYLDLRWKPKPSEIASLDRSGVRHLFYVAIFRSKS